MTAMVTTAVAATVTTVAMRKSNHCSFVMRVTRIVIAVARKDICHQIVQRKTQERRVIGACMRR